jgi:hypothetical protein
VLDETLFTFLRHQAHVGLAPVITGARPQKNFLKETKMFTEYSFNLFIVAVLVVAVSLTACVSSAQSHPADRFAGTWSGTMSFTDDANRKEDIIVTIPTGCTAGSVCGDLNNTTVKCQWEMTLGTVNGDAFNYKFSKTLSGECPALGGGTLTMQSDGTLMREHKTPNFTASGVLTKK